MAKNVVGKTWNLIAADGYRDSKPLIIGPQDPIWSQVPDGTFQKGQGVQTFDITPYVYDPNDDVLYYTVEGTLPNGVTFDSGVFTYDGVGNESIETVRVHATDVRPVVPGDTIVTLGLIPKTTGTTIPFTFGHTFREGDIPVGYEVGADIPEFQASVRNRWRDGSVKYAVLSGHFDGTVDTQFDINIGAVVENPTPPTEIQESTLATINPDFQTVFTNVNDVSLDTTNWSELTLTVPQLDVGVGDYIDYVDALDTTAIEFGAIVDQGDNYVTIQCRGKAAAINTTTTVTWRIYWYDFSADLTKSQTYSNAMSIRAGGGYPNNSVLRWNSISYPLTDCIGQTADWTTDQNLANGLVRSFKGSQMSEFHYICTNPAEEHLHVMYYVRVYKYGAVEVETVVENGWTYVNNPPELKYSVRFDMNGQTRGSYTDLVMKHHTRFSRVDWVGTERLVYPVHNTRYLSDSRVFPNYRDGTPLNSAWENILPMPAYEDALRPTPFLQYDLTLNMQNPVGNGALAIIPSWDVMYMMGSTDTRAYPKMEQNARAVGMYSIWYRYEQDGGAIGINRDPLIMVNPYNDNYAYGTSTSAEYLPLPTGTNSAARWDNNHLTNVGWMAYYISGRWPFLEAITQQAWATQMNMQSQDRPLGEIQVRGVFWSFRQMGTALAALPDTDKTTGDANVKADIKYIFDARLAAMVDTSARNELGLPYVRDDQYLDEGSPPFSTYWNDPSEALHYEAWWQYGYGGCSIAWLTDIDIPTMTTTERDQLIAIRNKFYRMPVGMMSKLPTANWRFFCGVYALPIGPVVNSNNPDLLYNNWGEVWTNLLTTPTVTGESQTELGIMDITDADGSSIFHQKNGKQSPYYEINITAPGSGGDWFASLSLPGTHVSEVRHWLAWAVDHGYPGARAAHDRMEGSVSWVWPSDYKVDEVHNAIRPREDNP